MKRRANNAFFRLWGSGYAGADEVGASMWGNQPCDGLARLRGDWDITGGGMSEAGKGVTDFITQAATAMSKGAMQIWKNGGLAIDNDGTMDSWREQGSHACRYGCLLGWANSGFTEDTDVLIDVVVFGTVRTDVDLAWSSDAKSRHRRKSIVYNIL